MMKIAWPDLEALSPNAKRITIGVAVATAVGITTWIGVRLSNANATPPAGTSDAAAPAQGSPAAAANTGPSAPPAPMPTTVEIQFTTYPAVRATVTWGKTVLGRIAPGEPLVVTRPRDSGPLDVVVSAP